LEGLIFLEVVDNGCGITNIDMEKQDSFGIRGMRERCQQLKGNFHIAGDPGKGTKVTILIPTGNLDYQPHVVELEGKLKGSVQPQAAIKKKKKVSRL
jgi:signal transduction histidine kinase